MGGVNYIVNNPNPLPCYTIGVVIGWTQIPTLIFTQPGGHTSIQYTTLKSLAQSYE